MAGKSWKIHENPVKDGDLMGFTYDKD